MSPRLGFRSRAYDASTFPRLTHASMSVNPSERSGCPPSFDGRPGARPVDSVSQPGRALPRLPHGLPPRPLASRPRASDRSPPNDRTGRRAEVADKRLHGEAPTGQNRRS